MSISAFVLLIDGCPVGFASPGFNLSSIPTGSADWNSGISSGSIIQHSLVSNIGNWTERVSPLDGLLEIGSLSFKIHDREVTYNGATRNIATYLLTREDQESTQISSTVSKTSTSISLQAPFDSFTGTNFVVWIDKEAILCSSISSGNITVSQRGYYGTVAKEHAVNTANIYYPSCFQEYPGVIKQRVKLFAQKDDGSCFVLWRGYVNRAPRLANNGAMIELQCDHIWNLQKQESFSLPSVKVRAAGVDPRYISLNSSLISGRDIRGSGTAIADTRGIMWSLNMYYGVQSASRNFINFLRYTRDPVIDIARLGHMVQEIDGNIIWTFKSADTQESRITIAGESASSQAGAVQDGLTSYTCTIPNFPVLQRVGADFVDCLMVESLDGVPAVTAASGSSATCFSRDCWYSEFEEQDKSVVFYPTSQTQTNPIARILGTAEIRNLTPGGPSTDNERFFITSRATFNLSKMLFSDHWTEMFRHGIIYQYLDSRDWGFDSLPRTKDALGHTLSRGGMILNGTKTIEELLRSYLKFYGAAVTTTTDGKLSFAAIKKPSAADTSVVTLSSADYVDKPKWELGEDALCNTIEVLSKGLAGEKTVINDQESKGLYGPGSIVEVDLSGIYHEADFIINTPALVSHLSNRFFGIFSKPYGVATLYVTMEHVETIFPGSIVTISDWLIPNGEGTRGTSSKKGFVISRNVDLSKGVLEIEVILFKQDEDNGYSPCVRVQSIAGAVLTIDQSYISTGNTGAISDYAGSNTAGYRHTANDRGIGFFNVGDKVELILRDSTDFSTESFTISAVDSTTITLNATPTSSPVNWSTEASSGKVDLRFSPFSTSGLTNTQKSYAYIGSVTTGKIASTTKNKRFKV